MPDSEDDDDVQRRDHDLPHRPQRDRAPDGQPVGDEHRGRGHGGSHAGLNEFGARRISDWPSTCQPRPDERCVRQRRHPCPQEDRRRVRAAHQDAQAELSDEEEEGEVRRVALRLQQLTRQLVITQRAPAPTQHRQRGVAGCSLELPTPITCRWPRERDRRPVGLRLGGDDQRRHRGHGSTRPRERDRRRTRRALVPKPNGEARWHTQRLGSLTRVARRSSILSQRRRCSPMSRQSRWRARIHNRLLAARAAACAQPHCSRQTLCLRLRLLAVLLCHHVCAVDQTTTAQHRPHCFAAQPISLHCLGSSRSMSARPCKDV